MKLSLKIGISKLLESFQTYVSSPEGQSYISDWIGVLFSMGGAWWTLRSIRKLGDDDHSVAERAKKDAKFGGWFALAGGVIWFVKTLA